MKSYGRIQTCALRFPKPPRYQAAPHPVNTPGGTRTLTKQILSLPPLPIGLQESVEFNAPGETRTHT